MIFKGWRDGLGGEHFRVEEAAPVEKFSLELLEQAVGSDRLVVDNGVIKITADNGRWVYRINDYDHPTRTFTAEWV